MRVLLLLLAACGSGDDPCPSGNNSPAYCFARGTDTCGPCSHVGQVCYYFEASLTCACDHQWWCSYAPHGCRDAGPICGD
jgi:hypothetical protein